MLRGHPGTGTDYSLSLVVFDKPAQAKYLLFCNRNHLLPGNLQGTSKLSVDVETLAKIVIVENRRHVSVYSG